MDEYSHPSETIGFDLLLSIDDIWQYWSESTMAQVTACCVTAPSHYLKQCWLMIKCVLRHSAESIFTINHDDVIKWKHFPRYTDHLCGEFTGPGEFPTQRPVTRSFDVYFDLCPNKWLSKQSWGWWFETLSCSLWRHRNGLMKFIRNTCSEITLLKLLPHLPGPMSWLFIHALISHILCCKRVPRRTINNLMWSRDNCFVITPDRQLNKQPISRWNDIHHHL